MSNKCGHCGREIKMGENFETYIETMIDPIDYGEWSDPIEYRVDVCRDCTEDEDTEFWPGPEEGGEDE
jgi:hypothetical protein